MDRYLVDFYCTVYNTYAYSGEHKFNYFSFDVRFCQIFKYNIEI